MKKEENNLEKKALPKEENNLEKKALPTEKMDHRAEDDDGDLEIEIDNKDKDKDKKEENLQDKTKKVKVGEEEIETSIEIKAEDGIDYENNYIKSAVFLSEPVYASQTWNIQAPCSEEFPLEIIGVSFNGYDDIYILATSKELEKLYIGRYNYQKNEFSNFDAIASLTEEVYEATLCKETKKVLHWFLLGKTTIWQLEINKADLSNTANDFKLLPFNIAQDFFERNNGVQNYEGGSLVSVNQLPWIVGGRIENGKADAGRRLFMCNDWLVNTTGSLEQVRKVQVIDNFLIQKRTFPIVYLYGKNLICIGGNQSNKENIAEHIDFYSAFSDKTNRMIERSVICYEQDNCDINIQFPRAASCLCENAIFIFTDKLFSEKKPRYYKYNFLTQGTTSSGNHAWQFLSPNISPDALKFSSVKAISIGHCIYLFLFRIETNRNKTHIKVFKILPFN